MRGFSIFVTSAMLVFISCQKVPSHERTGKVKESPQKAEAIKSESEVLVGNTLDDYSSGFINAIKSNDLEKVASFFDESICFGDDSDGDFIKVEKKSGYDGFLEKKGILYSLFYSKDIFNKYLGENNNHWNHYVMHYPISKSVAEIIDTSSFFEGTKATITNGIAGTVNAQITGDPNHKYLKFDLRKKTLKVWRVELY